VNDITIKEEGMAPAPDAGLRGWLRIFYLFHFILLSICAGCGLSTLNKDGDDDDMVQW